MKQKRIYTLSSIFFLIIFLIIASVNPEKSYASGIDRSLSSLNAGIDAFYPWADTIPGNEQVRMVRQDTIIQRRVRRFPGAERIMPDSIHLSREYPFLKPGGPGDRRFLMAGDSIMPPPPKIFRFERRENQHVIDLTDPGIISYKRKKIRGGKEKVIIIREVNSDRK